MERPRPPLPPEAKKPEVLYHASKDPDVEEFVPRNEKIRDPLEGPVVFATPDKAYASCFLVPSDDSWVKISRWSTDGEPGPWNVIVNDKDRFEELDTGGAIYHLPGDSFDFDSTKNLGDTEWTSRAPVKPSDKEVFDSGLDAMKSLGVKVYFVDSETFAEIEAAEDHGKSIVDSLTPEA